MFSAPAEAKSEYDDGVIYARAGALIVFEVLSEGTAAHDRGRKFLSYHSIDSLQELVFVS